MRYPANIIFINAIALVMLTLGFVIFAKGRELFDLVTLGVFFILSIVVLVVTAKVIRFLISIKRIVKAEEFDRK